MSQNRITVVGCGFVGSIFTDEMLKRMFAGKLPQAFRFIDYDTVDDRNAANQNFLVSDQGKLKAEVMLERAIKSGKHADMLPEKLTIDNINHFLDGAVLIIDAVDNLEARQLLWNHAIATGVPVLHLGISEQGTGKVEWTHPQHDTFSLSPKHTFGKEIKEPESGVTPPCELARMRGVGLNTGFAAAMAAAIYFGFDPEAHLKGELSHDWMTEWASTPMGFMPIRETWAKIDAAS